MIRIIVMFAVFSTATWSWADDGRHDVSLEQNLQHTAGEIIDWLQAHGCRNVGVLKFHVQKGRVPTLHSGGVLNMSMANRLETALILAVPSAEAEQIHVVRRASSIASAIPDGDLLSPAWRRQLFAQMYPVAWGDAKTKLDAIVTGVVTVTPDFRRLCVRFSVLQPQGPIQTPIAKPIVVPTTGAILNELGESYQLRGVGSGTAAADAVRDLRANQRAQFPLLDQPAVSLQILYDGHALDLERIKFSDGEASIPEPEVGQSVTFRIDRLDRASGALAAVLKVNGQNVLFKERMPDIDCSKYIFERNSAAIVVEGYQTEQDQAEAFRVAGQAESRNVEMYYGEDVGTISLAVFREATAHAVPPPTGPDPELGAIAQGWAPAEPGATLPALQQQMRAHALGTETRGLIVPGDGIASRVQFLEKRDWHPEPVMSVVLRYYRPNGEP